MGTRSQASCLRSLCSPWGPPAPAVPTHPQHLPSVLSGCPIVSLLLWILASSHVWYLAGLGPQRRDLLVAEGPGICLSPCPSFLFVDVISVLPNLAGAEVGLREVKWHIFRGQPGELLLPKWHEHPSIHPFIHSFFSGNKREPTTSCWVKFMVLRGTLPRKDT